MTHEEIDERYREAALDDNAGGWDDPETGVEDDEDDDSGVDDLQEEPE